MHDFHVHSSFSGDCNYSMEDMIKGGIKSSVETIVFTDHIDYEYGDKSINFVFDIKDFLKDFTKLKNKYHKEIKVLSGLEIGMQPHLSDKNSDLVINNDLDFIIMSTHIVNGLNLHDGQFFEDKNPEDIYTKYYNEVYNNLRNFDNFDVLGHINLIDRYNKHINGSIDLNSYKEILIQVLKEVIVMGKGIEINTSGIKYGIDSFLPNMEILKLYKDLGGEIITIGSDAHSPLEVCNHYEDAKELLKEVGYKYITLFDKRKPKFIKIE